MTTRAWVDFNDLDRQGTTRTVAYYADGELPLGTAVTAWDDEGNTCAGQVTAVDGEVVTLALNLSTFHSQEAS